VAGKSFEFIVSQDPNGTGMDSNGIRPYVIAKGKTFNNSFFLGFRKENYFTDIGQLGMVEVLSF